MSPTWSTGGDQPIQILIFKYNKMSDHLNLLLIYHNIKKHYPIKITHKQLYLSQEEIFARVKHFLEHQRRSVSTYLNFWIESKGIKQNLFKLCKKGVQLRLSEVENGQFEIKVIIEQGSQKINVVKSFDQNFQNYQRIKNNIQRIKMQSADYQKNQHQKTARNIDIAFFFSDPLVQVKFDNKSYEIKVKNEVSYQVQYDKFIEMVKGKEFKRNLKIQMLVATETNIKNTLTRGASILHFACHGQTNWLEIENEKKVGELVTLEKEKLLGIINSGYLPKVIIFNACQSQNLAKQIAKQINKQKELHKSGLDLINQMSRSVSKDKKIITIGYKGNANDKYCQKFTKDFYMGVFVNQKPVRETFNKIKQEITNEKPEEGIKLSIFPEEEDSQFEEAKISQPAEQNTNYIVKWNMLENLRRRDCLGVKKEMHRFIQSLTNNQSMSYIFLKGEKDTGKTNFIEKTKIYTINRKVFTDQLVIDLKKKNGNFTQTLLQMKLDYQAILQTWKVKMEKKLKEERVSCLVVIDHSQSLVQYQYSEFTKYIQEQIKQKVKWGKIVIITRNVYPFDKNDEKRYLKAIFHAKDKENITLKQFKDFTSRYFGVEYDDEIKRIKDLRSNLSFTVLVKALKLSFSPSQIEENIKKVQSITIDPYPEFIQQNQIAVQLKRLDRQVTKLLQNINIEIKENHHTYISTILEEIAANNYHHKNYNILERSNSMQAQMVYIIVKDFNYFFQKAFRYQQKKSIESFKQMARLSLRIAGLCYLTECRFKQHMLNCEKMRVMAISMLLSPHTIVQAQGSQKQIKNEEPAEWTLPIKNFSTLLSQYRIKILLTLYSYFTQCQGRLKYMDDLPQETRLELEECCKKQTIIQNQLYEQIHKRGHQNEVQNSERFVTKFKILNSIIQQIHFHPKYTLLHQNQNTGDEDYVKKSIKQIYAHHAKIDEYWKSYQSLKHINMRGQNQILSKDSMVIFFLNIIKLINFNQVQLEHLHSKGESLFKREMIEYTALYVKILKTIDQSQVFPQRNYSHSDYVIWKFPQNFSIKMLFKKYFKLFVNVYFQLEKIRQNLTKDYSLKIFNQLLKQCDSHPRIPLISIKNGIQTHKNQQFLGAYCCQTFIAVPLVNEKREKINIKRLQSHIYRFQEVFFANLEREVKTDVYLLNKQLFAEKQRPQRSLIQLLVCDCTHDYVQCQSVTGEGQFIERSRINSLPNAPIVIIFGTNVRNFFDKLFRNEESVLITIDIQQPRRSIQSKMQAKLTFEERMQILQQQTFRLEISYSLLQYFYTSFCKHFFTVDHSCFSEQVKSSFYLAKAEALMKTKIRFQAQSKIQLKRLIGQYAKRIEMTISQYQQKQIASKPAYHFMFKTLNESNVLKVIGSLALKDEIQVEIGCNLQISSLFSKLQKCNRSSTFVYLYKSNEMKRMFINTITCKVKKSRKYVLQSQTIVSENLLDLRKSVSKRYKDSQVQGQKQKQAILDQPKAIILYENISEEDFNSQCKYAAERDELTTIRIFLSPKKYINCSSKIQQQYIQESYDTQKLQFELFFIEYKKQKPDNQRGLTECFKKFIDKAQLYGSLHQLKAQLQNRNH